MSFHVATQSCCFNSYRHEGNIPNYRLRSAIITTPNRTPQQIIYYCVPINPWKHMTNTPGSSEGSFLIKAPDWVETAQKNLALIEMVSLPVAFFNLRLNWKYIYNVGVYSCNYPRVPFRTFFWLCQMNRLSRNGWVSFTNVELTEEKRRRDKMTCKNPPNSLQSAEKSPRWVYKATFTNPQECSGGNKALRKYNKN